MQVDSVGVIAIVVMSVVSWVLAHVKFYYELKETKLYPYFMGIRRKQINAIMMSADMHERYKWKFQEDCYRCGMREDIQSETTVESPSSRD